MKRQGSRPEKPLAHIRDAHGKLPAYAWPGGYPIFYLTKKGNVLCPKCANKEGVRSEDPPTAHDANWEDPDLYCEGCNKRIESAYAEKD